MDDKKVNPENQELQNRYPNLSILIGGGKQDNDGIEGDDNFNPFHDDVEWYE